MARDQTRLLRWLVAVVLGVLAFQALAQGVNAERQRLQAERAAADARFASQEQACRARFAVNDCVRAAAREHNAIRSDLRRQERVLDDAERRANAAERLRELDERSSPQQQQQAAERRAKALADRQEREARAAEKAAKRAQQEAERTDRAPRSKLPGGPPQPQGKAREPRAAEATTITPEQAARNRQAYEQRIREAEAHAAEVRERLATRRQSPASDLPSPP